MEDTRRNLMDAITEAAAALREMAGECAKKGLLDETHFYINEQRRMFKLEQRIMHERV